MKRALLLGAFYLLSSAAPANAECSWILWVKDSGTYVPQASFDARGPCIDNIVSLAKEADEKGNLLFVGPE